MPYFNLIAQLPLRRAKQHFIGLLGGGRGSAINQFAGFSAWPLAYLPIKFQIALYVNTHLTWGQSGTSLPTCEPLLKLISCAIIPFEFMHYELVLYIHSCIAIMCVTTR